MKAEHVGHDKGMTGTSNRALAAGAVLIALLSGGCAEVWYGPDHVDAALIAPDSFEEIGVLRFLNSPDCTLAVLDDSMSLDSRAANNIFDHIRGADGVLGTPDDDTIGSIYELDAIPWVGPVALTRILDFVTAAGGIPVRNVENVALTDGEIEAILVAANAASFEELDVAAALDSRAAGALVVGRPHADIDAVAAASYVGRVAIDKLRLWAPTWSAPVLEPDPNCAGVYYPGDADVRAAALDLNELLAIATPADQPYAEVLVVSYPLCVDLSVPSVARDDLAARLGTQVEWGYDDDPPWSVSPWVENTGAYPLWLGWTRDSVLEAVADGRFVPSASARGAELFANLDTMIETLSVDGAANPGVFHAITVSVDASECSQHAAAVYDSRDGTVRIVHRFPGC